MCFVMEIQGLLPLNVKGPGENDPTDHQCGCESNSEYNQISPHGYSFGAQFRFEKNC